MSDITAADLAIAANFLKQLKGQESVPQYKHTQPAGAHSNPTYNGPISLWGDSGGVPERDVFSTRIQLRGFLSALSWRGTNKLYPLFPYLTGFQAGSGSEPTTSCDTCKTPGPGKTCYQTAVMGQLCRDTRELDITRVGQQSDAGSPFDLRLLNDPLGQDLARQWFPSLPSSDALVNGREALARMIEVGIDMTNAICPLLYTGNPANNSGDYKEFPGLDILIGTNKVDAETGTDCPALDSVVRDWNYAKVNNDDNDIVAEFTRIMRYLRSNASRMGYDPATWVIVMREELFYQLTALWPCAYISSGCSVRPNGLEMGVDAGDQIAMRDAMRNGQYLLIDSKQVPVVFDDCITEEDEGDNAAIDPACYASDVYFVPMTVLGGRVVTYMEYYNWAPAIQAANDMNYQGTFWSDGGAFLWARLPNVATCIQLKVKHWSRLIFQAPFLAARLTNVQYCTSLHTREPLNSQNYFVNGGVTTDRPAPSYFSDWNLRGQ